ncbi:MAG TPA: hypothetical protein VGJ97_09125 [Anaerolineaceae bacterium]
MNKIDCYRTELRQKSDWDDYLLAESHLPGPRGNLELLQAVVEEGEPDRLMRYAARDAEQAPTNTPGEFLAACGTAGLGRLLAEGQCEYLPTLRSLASDSRWRVREAVAMALQRWGDTDLSAMTNEAEVWAQGSLLEQRAMVAGLCEPRLLKSPVQARRVLALLDQTTHGILQNPSRKTEEFRILRQALAYAWSVAVAALPDEGKPVMQVWLACPDPDVAWVMKENLKKKRIAGLFEG